MPVYEEKEKINGQKRWFIRTYVTDENGNRKQVTRHNKEWLGRDGYNLAHQEEVRLKNKVLNIKRADVKIEELFDSYMTELSSTSKLATIKKNRDNIIKHILPYFKNVKIKNIDNRKILDWKYKIEEKNLSLSFKKNIFISFSSMLNHGCKYYDLPNNPAKIVGNFKNKKGNIYKRDMKIMDEDQFKHFIENEINELYKLVFTVLFYTGMRRGEMLALTWDDVNFKNNTITISKTYNPKIKDEFDNSPKTNKSNRTIKMLPIVHNQLKKYKNNQSSHDSIFENVTLTTLKRHCDKNCKNIGIDNFRIHDFRHSFASMCIDKDVPINIISDYLGHENISTTLDTYSHLYPNSQDKLINKFL